MESPTPLNKGLRGEGENIPWLWTHFLPDDVYGQTAQGINSRARYWLTGIKGDPVIGTSALLDRHTGRSAAPATTLGGRTDLDPFSARRAKNIFFTGAGPVVLQGDLARRLGGFNVNC